MIVYLIEDNFQSPSTRVLDKISMSTVALFVSAYQEHITLLKIMVQPKTTFFAHLRDLRFGKSFNKMQTVYDVNRFNVYTHSYDKTNLQ